MKRFAAILLALFATVTAASAASLLPPGKNCFYDADGASLAAGSVTFYIPSTTTPKDTWQDSGEAVANTNPVTLDGSGCALIYGSGTYREILKDSTGATVWDQLTADPASNVPEWGGTGTGTANAQAVVAGGFSTEDGQTIYYLASATNTGAMTLSVSSGSPIPVVKDTLAGAVALSGGEVTAGNVIGVIYSASGSRFHLISAPQVSTDYQDFLASGTWTKPSWAAAYTGSTTRVLCWGGGGAGGANAQSGGGGGGASATYTFLTSVLGSTETITIGAGGAVNSSGSNSTFGSWLTAYGGGAGRNNATSGGGGGGGATSKGSDAPSGTGGAGGGPQAAAGGAPGTFGTYGGGGGTNGGYPNSNGGGAIFGGGGGGGGDVASAGDGGVSVFGGGGGAGGVAGPGSGGASTYGGHGGASGVAGSVPGGGGGRNAAGGAGECRVWTTP